MKKLQKYLVDTLTLSSDTKMTLGKKRLSTTVVEHLNKTKSIAPLAETNGQQLRKKDIYKSRRHESISR